MEIFLVRYEIITTRGTGPFPGSILSGHFIEVSWDDVANEFKVYEFTSAVDTVGDLRTSGPDLGHISQDGRDNPDTMINRSGSVPNPNPRVGGFIKQITYSFCDSTTLVRFDFQSLFPYVKKINEPDSTSCFLAVCDLTFTSYNTTPASDSLVSDGVINVEATSSYGPIKFSLDPNFDYTTQGQSLGTFPGLSIGDYVVTAKDARGCTAQVSLKVVVPDFYNTKYRLEYRDLKDRPTRTDILQRGYIGDVIEVQGTGDPVVIESVDTSINKFTPIVPSSLVLGLLSPTNFYFQELFSQDERKFLIKHYKDFGNTRPAFIPDELDDIGDWLQTSFPSSPFFGTYKSWTGLSVSMSGNIRSQNKYTIYNLVAGQTYSFNYSFTVSSTFGSKQIREIIIGISNESWSYFLSETIKVFSAGTVTGTFTFVAPEGADRIYIKAVQFAPTTSYLINSFENVTESTGEESVGLELKWNGYVINQNYKEAYLPPPYPVFITASDGLADLKTFDFLDESGNEIRNDITPMQAISQILLKTDLGINILSAVNKFEADMDSGPEYDPLNQCLFDPKIFLGKDCDFVISEILKPFGAKLRMRNAQWFIYCVEQSVAEMDYREFNSLGEYITNGTVNDNIDIKGPLINDSVSFRDGSQGLEVIPAYGKFYLKHELLKNPSLIKSYSFEEEDVDTRPDGVRVLKNWGVLINEDPGATYGIKETKAFEGKYNFFYKVGIAGGAGEKYITLTSIGGEIEYNQNDDFEFRFSYSVILGSTSSYYLNPLWVRLKWMLKIGDLYFSEAFGGWTDDIDYKYNDIYVDSYNIAQEYKTVFDLPQVTELTLSDFDVEFVFTRSSTYDFESENGDLQELEEIPTVKKPLGYKVKGKATYINPRGLSAITFLYYELIDDDSTTDGIKIVRPNDYDEFDNPKVWQIASEIWVKRALMRTENVFKNDPSGEAAVIYNYLDNVVLKHLPNGNEPPDDITIESVNNNYIKINFEETYQLNDIDTDNINNSERTYRNFFKLLDGTPTKLWTRTYRAGDGKLLDLLTSEIKTQYKKGSNKLTGTFDIDTETLPTSVLKEIFDSNKKYMFMGYTLHDRDSKVDFDIAEIIDVVTDDESPEIDAGFTIGFSLGFRA